ncbi:MAG: type II secretion system protein N [Gammaproteobacteria bacterium]|nr:type II secretion system protein N [Gammaproteobacteria bacterium]
MSLSRGRLIAIAVAVLLLGLIIKLPARVAYHMAGIPGVAVGGLQGSVWNGSAKEASLGSVYLRDISWRLKPAGLFGGSLSYHVEATPASGFLQTDVSVGTSGSVHLTDLQAALPLAMFAPAVGLDGLAGNASAQMERLEIVDGLAVAADGVLQVADLVVPEVSRASLGGYKAEFFTQEDGVVASIEDTDGVVDLAGSVQLSADRQFLFIAQVVAKNSTPQALRQRLEFLPANDRDQREIRLEGSL